MLLVAADHVGSTCVLAPAVTAEEIGEEPTNDKVAEHREGQGAGLMTTIDWSGVWARSFLALIERHLSEVWQAYARSGNRSLRVVLRSAEALLAERAGMDSATRPDHHPKP